MNHNSFPSGEQSPSQSEGGDIAEYPSFEEHMQNMEQQNGEKQSLIERAKNAIHNLIHRREWVRQNTEVLTRPTMKNEDLRGNSYIGVAQNEVSRKIKNGEPLSIKNVTSMAEEYGYGQGYEGLGDLLEEIGVENGTDFDVQQPGTLISPNGEEIQHPLSISFRNNQGDFTRIDLYKDAPGEGHAISYSGAAEEGVDVGYSGPIKLAKDRKNLKYTTFSRQG